jgi:hypothetical protein
MVAEISRVLKNNGVWIEVTYGNPESRTPVFERAKNPWRIETATLRK